MKPEVAKKLIDLNQQFYQTFAEPFSGTRMRLQPGVERILDTLPPDASLLDLGCGNGKLAEVLRKRGHQGAYLGLDSSPGLIEIACSYSLEQTSFQLADFSSPDWDSDLSDAPFSFIFCFATLHHLPGAELRIDFLKKVHGLLNPKGSFVLSNWQFMNSPKLRARVQSWDRIGLTENEVNEGDYLLDWRLKGEGLRYVHYYSSSELHGLAYKSNFKITGVFTSDGETGDLGLYQIWERSE